MKLDNIIQLRHKLHQHPEISREEKNTAQVIVEYMKQLSPDEIIRFDNYSLAFIFKSDKPGPNVLFRADLDALPIEEKNTIPYKSLNTGAAHVCGHDGHMAILAGLGEVISQNKPKKGSVILLFQASEEVGEGAEFLVNDQKFRELKPDFIFGLHNIPGFEKGKIIIPKTTFAAASKGQIIMLNGKTSHAAEPENGISPVKAVEKIINQYHELGNNKSLFKDFSLLTMIHIRLGEKAFGTSPGYAEVLSTLRSYRNDDIELMTQKTEEIIAQVSKQEKLKYNISYTEVFPATVNDDQCNEMISKAANENSLSTHLIDQPFPWSEDFGYYNLKYKSAMFGLGSGTNQPPLHNPDYDFPDDIIEMGIKMFESIYKQLLF